MKADPDRLRAPVAMLVHAYYEEDARVRRKAEALVAAGREVDVFALRRADDMPDGELDGVRITRLPVGRHQGAGLATYLAEYLAFFARSGIALVRAHRRRRYGLVEVNTLPDFLVFAALPLKLAGVPLVLDLHEAMPEFFRSRFPRASGRIARGVLSVQERLSIRVADAVVTVNDSLAARLVERGVPPEKITVVLNAPAMTLFDPSRFPQRPFMADGRLRLVYAGALTPIYELDVVLRAIAALRERRPDLPVELDVFGRGDSEAGLVALAASLGIAGAVRFNGRVPLEAIPAAVAVADIGVAPTRRDRFTELSLSTKLFEYAAMGKPVIASRLPTVERYFPPGSVTTYEPGNAGSV
ncbi:MAG TPA: glycosyltransferase family 4 protein, partial [Clostridia bacterium]|nr:glycosyltransferase family 4 protein [Clostridia bacterium]